MSIPQKMDKSEYFGNADSNYIFIKSRQEYLVCLLLFPFSSLPPSVVFPRINIVVVVIVNGNMNMNWYMNWYMNLLDVMMVVCVNFVRNMDNNVLTAIGEGLRRVKKLVG